MIYISTIEIDCHYRTSRILSSVVIFIIFYQLCSVYLGNSLTFALLQLTLVLHRTQTFTHFVRLPDLFCCYFLVWIAILHRFPYHLFPEQHWKIDHGFFGFFSCSYTILFEHLLDDIDVCLHCIKYDPKWIFKNDRLTHIQLTNVQNNK